jgi:hypothetical protein
MGVTRVAATQDENGDTHQFFFCADVAIPAWAKQEIKVADGK